jgi:hypothetical protein
MNDPDEIIRQQRETIETLVGLLTDVHLFLEFRKFVDNEDGPQIQEMMASDVEPHRKSLLEDITTTMDRLIDEGRIGEE